MRITFVTPAPSLRGGFRSVAIYAERLRRRGHRVQIVARLRPPQPLKAKLRAWLRGQGWPRWRPDTSYLDGRDIPLQLVAPGRPVTDADVPDADVVIATWWQTAEWVARLSASKGVKVALLQDHEVFPSQPVARVEATWRLPMHKIVVSRWLADLARDRYGDPHASYVPYGVDREQFHAPPRTRAATPTVGLVYSREPRKACEVALRAVARAAARVPGLRLVAFGAQEPAPDHPLPDGAEFHLRPPQASLRTLYAGADAWLFSSRTEGFGMPLLEAMACRTPVIAAPGGAAPDLVADDRNGWLLDAADAELMAEAIVRLAALDAARWAAMSEAALATAQAHTWEHATAQFERALARAVERADRGELGGS